MTDESVRHHHVFSPRTSPEWAPENDHRIVAVMQNGQKIAGPAQTWNEAQARWLELDDARRAGRAPHVRYFAVRSTDDPQWSGIDVLYKPGYFNPVESTRGFSSASAAAKRASELYMDDETPNGRANGTAGWYYQNGSAIAQGRHGLIIHTKARQWIVNVGERWFVLDKTPVPATTTNA